MSLTNLLRGLCVVLACWCAPPVTMAAEAAPSAPNLLRDGGFDGATAPAAACPGVSGQLAAAWSDNTCWNQQSKVRYELDESQARSGRSQKVVLSQGLFQLTQQLALQADWRYGLGVWVRSETPMVVKLSLRKNTAPYLEYGSRNLRTSAQWTYLSVSAFSNGLSDAEALQAVFIVSSATPGTLWMDSAVLTGARSNLVLPAAEVPPQFFGAHALHLINTKTALDDGKMGSLRIWDSERSQWNTIQPSRPKNGKRKYGWDALDDRVDSARDHQADVMMVIGGYAPSWASLNDGEPDDGSLRGASDANWSDETPKRAHWKTWVTDLVTRYKGSPLKYWEVWNEPNFGPKDDWCPDQQVCLSKMASGYRGTPEQLLALQNDAATIIKGIDPAAQIVSAGVSLYHREYLDYFLKIGGGKTADIIGYHIYVDGPPELLMPHILALRGLMRDHGVSDKPLWNTEGGVAQLGLELDPAWREAKARGLDLPRPFELGPAYLARSLIVAWASGMGRWYHYAWDGGHAWPSATSVIARGTNLAIDTTDGGVAYRQLVGWMVGKRMVAFESGQNGGLWQATLQDAAGKLSYIAWHPARTMDHPWSLKKPASVRTTCDLAGKCRSLASDAATVPLDFKPVYLSP
ncbi:MAG: hypothetical protein EOP36_15980 [Rubrivivax sp.]|nr:MAG: hypothetical protein EOP36_15980 [Rubrivivax sp.]